MNNRLRVISTDDILYQITSCLHRIMDPCTNVLSCTNRKSTKYKLYDGNSDGIALGFFVGSIVGSYDGLFNILEMFNIWF